MKHHLDFDIDFRRNPYKGRYIVVEGIDGSGKTTQVKKLCFYFKKNNMPYVCTAEPRKDKGVIGKLIQQILKAKVNIPSVAFQYLFSAERAIHYEEVIIPALKAGKCVVSDRCFWSAVPYGIMDMERSVGEDYDFGLAKVILAAQSILSMYHQFIVPDFTFYLDISTETAMRRMSQKKDKEIYEKKEKLDKIVKGYEWLLKEFPKEFVVVDGNKAVEEVAGDIISNSQNSNRKSQSCSLKLKTLQLSF